MSPEETVVPGWRDQSVYDYLRKFFSLELYRGASLLIIILDNQFYLLGWPHLISFLPLLLSKP